MNYILNLLFIIKCYISDKKFIEPENNLDILISDTVKTLLNPKNNSFAYSSFTFIDQVKNPW